MNPMHHVDGASARVVNRTHRILRARAVAMNTQRDALRSLWLPMSLCASVLVVLLFAGIDMTGPSSVEGFSESIFSFESGDWMAVLLMWFLPLTIAAGVVVWFRQFRAERRKRR